MNRRKMVITLTVFALLLSSILAVSAYTNLSSQQATAPLATLEPPTPPPFQLQVTSPIDNYTYGTYNGPENLSADQEAHETTYSLILPLNITANQEASEITYSLDGSKNMTFNWNATLTLSYGVHNLVAYATNREGIASESNITFTVGYNYLLSVKITREQIQQATSYFESRGLKVQPESIDESKWQNLMYFLYAGSVDVASKERFADIVIAHGIDTVVIYQDSNQVSFYVRIYDAPEPLRFLPILYSYSAAIA